MIKNDVPPIDHRVVITLDFRSDFRSLPTETFEDYRLWRVLRLKMSQRDRDALPA